LIHFLTGEGEIRIGTLAANRGHSEIEGTIGYFTNTVILRSKLAPILTVQEVLEQVKRTTITAFDHQELPFEYLVRQLERECNIHRDDLFRTLLIYQKSDRDVVELAGLRFASLRLQPLAGDTEVTITACDLVFNFRESSTSLTGVLTFKMEVISKDDACEMARQLETILNKMIADPSQKICAFHSESSNL
jgi:aspartate racemase